MRGSAETSTCFVWCTMWSQRVFDVAFAVLLLIPLAPVMTGVALALYLSEGRPVLYGAERMRSVTEGFTLWKFRTMRPVAEDSGVSGGDKADRITPFGRWLRATRLDELPQLWNILRGDIGFVGPRPPLRRYVERFPGLYARVLESRPGVTGLATLTFQQHERQILSQSTSAAQTEALYQRRCVPRKATLDLIYQRNRSLCLDLSLIVQTGLGVLTRHKSPKRRAKRRS